MQVCIRQSKLKIRREDEETTQILRNYAPL